MEEEEREGKKVIDKNPKSLEPLLLILSFRLLLSDSVTETG